MANLKGYVKVIIILCVALSLPVIFTTLRDIKPAQVIIEAYPIDAGRVVAEERNNKVIVQAEEMPGYLFVGWYQNGQVVTQERNYITSIHSDIRLTAYFTKKVSVNIEVVANHDGGTVKGEGKYEAGKQVEIEAIPNVGYVFEGWAIDGEVVSKETTLSLVAEEDTTFTAQFSLNYKVDKPLQIEDGDYLLALVSKDTYLGGYVPTDLVKVDRKMNSQNVERYLREEAYQQLERMWEDARKDGVSLYVVSAYRSYERQRTIFSRNVSVRGEYEANRVSARAGESEHQLGTTVDFVGALGDNLSQSFAYTPSGKWLMLNAHKYGFAMSYPEGMETVTGYIFEPWHYRYIGVEAAMEWSESGLSLIEYLMTQPQFFVEEYEFVQGN